LTTTLTTTGNNTFLKSHFLFSTDDTEINTESIQQKGGSGTGIEFSLKQTGFEVSPISRERALRNSQ
jgi:hypothetical protein